ncbi:hypothetical protein C9374_005921 [Naegleria lovaniensis]|uniref:Teneurin NHL domain-containing protein n=1 Tax=Naegleria lovaniensis TaxID=51637 RepID=A0AA88KHT1_NAELO|nr:uncharacterized protein C9374_005921 [Naegleria lovaniensis]KAG2382129.1 hypothetical protein C9374_005921 [Naegleria lovaniensis]
MGCSSHQQQQKGCHSGKTLALILFSLILLILFGCTFSTSSTVKYIITTVAGKGGSVFGCADGTLALECGMKPFDVFVTATNEIYYSEYAAKRIMKIGQDGRVTTIAGGGNSTADNIPAVQSVIAWTMGVTVHPTTNDVYFTDVFGHKIRKVSGTTGIITTFAGTGGESSSGDGGPAINATMNRPFMLYLNHTTMEMFVAEANSQRIRKIFANGTITTIAGNGNFARGTEGGLAITSSMKTPSCVREAPNGDVFYMEINDSVLRRINKQTGILSTVAGTFSIGYNGDGIPARQASLSSPYGFVITDNGDIYIADMGNSRIRYIDAKSGNISTIAGISVSGFSGDGGIATDASIDRPSSLFRLPSGHIYIADFANNRIRLLTPTCDEGFVYISQNHSCIPLECFGINYNDTNVCSSHGKCIGIDRCTCHEDSIFYQDCSLLFVNSQNMLMTFSDIVLQAPINSVNIQVRFNHSRFLDFYNGREITVKVEIILNGQTITVKNQGINLANSTVTNLLVTLPTTISQPGNISAFIELWDVRTTMKISNRTQSLNSSQVVINNGPPIAVSSPSNNNNNPPIDTVAIAVGISVPFGILLIIFMIILIILIAILVLKKKKAKSSSTQHAATVNDMEMRE